MTTVLHVVPHTHWDREWYEPFEGYRMRLVRMVDRLLDALKTDPRLHFHFDGQTAAIEDYLTVRPEAEPHVAALVRAGRLTIGPWRILMDEFLCSAETIVRNLRQGMSTARRLGASPELGYIPDSFGHIAQMPQILALAGMKDACVWRGVPFAVDRPAFWWSAPDGTRLRTLYLATSYSNAASLPDDADDLIERGKRIAGDMAPFRPADVVLAMNGTDHRGLEEHLPAVFEEANKRNGEIAFRLGSLREYLADGAPSGGLPEWRGEMRSSARANLLMGVCSARMPLKRAEFEASAVLERYAEPLAVVAGFDAGMMIEDAWRDMVENSAHDSVCGCGIDAVADAVLNRYQRARRVGEIVANEALSILAERVARPADGILIFNPSAFARDGVTEATAPVPDGASLAADSETRAVQVLGSTEQVIVDMRLRGADLARLVPTIHSRMMGTLYVNRMELRPGRTHTLRLELGPIPIGRFDVEAAKREVESAALEKPRAMFHVIGAGPPLVRLLFDAPPTAGLGWSHVRLSEDAGSAPARTRAGKDWIENEHVRVAATPAGDIVITNVQTSLRVEGIGLIDGGDVGDEYTWCPPQKDIVVAAPFKSLATIVHDGPLEARLRLAQSWRVPMEADASRRRRARKTTTLLVTQEWAVRAGEGFARLDVRIENTAADHRLRLRVPLPFTTTGSDADQAFDITHRGLQAEGGPHETPTPSFPSRRWVDVSDGVNGVCIMHRGTPEYEVTENGKALEVTLLRSVGWLSRQDLHTRSGPAGPALPAPGAQCLGTHEASLAIAPHSGDWRAAQIPRLAEAFVYPMKAIGVHAGEGSLAEQGGAFGLEPPSVALSALERTPRGVEARIYNTADTEVTARITIGSPIQAERATLIGLLGDERKKVRMERGVVSVQMRAHEICSLRLE